jgi:predicted  nucleic acid-binding Zn-ribbon protein
MVGPIEYIRLKAGRVNPIPKRKRKILKRAEKELDKLEKQKTARTQAVEKATGVESDITKRKRDVARKARRSLMGG